MEEARSPASPRPCGPSLDPTPIVFLGARPGLRSHRPPPRGRRAAPGLRPRRRRLRGGRGGGKHRSAPQGLPKVLVEEVGRREMVRYLETTTTLESEREIPILPEVPGFVTAIEAEEGDRVAAGEVLCVLDDEDEVLAVEDAAVALEEAENAAAQTKLAIDRGGGGREERPARLRAGPARPRARPAALRGRRGGEPGLRAERSRRAGSRWRRPAATTRRRGSRSPRPGWPTTPPGSRWRAPRSP